MNSKLVTFLFIVLTITACSEVKDTRYQDTTELEVPPVMEIVEKPKQSVNTKEEILNQGLGERVQLAGTAEIPVIKIKKLFSRAWVLVEQALKLNDIEVKDKNRDLGVFYVLFVPKDEDSGGAAFFDGVSSFFSNDASRTDGYKLTVVWRESNTEVAAEFVQHENDGLLDDDEDSEDFAETVDSSAILINSLYKTMKHDLKID